MTYLSYYPEIQKIRRDQKPEKILIVSFGMKKLLHRFVKQLCYDGGEVSEGLQPL